MAPKIDLPIYLLVMVFFFANCTHVMEKVYQEPNTGEYLSAFPIQNTASYLERMQESVKRISSTSHYTTFFFDPGDQITYANIGNDEITLDELAVHSINSHTSRAGSAVVVHNRRNRIGMITTNHAFSSPDTIYSYTDYDSLYLESISVKTSQVNWLLDSPYMGTFEILVSDASADLAVIGTRVDPYELEFIVEAVFPIFPYKFGKPQNLQPGSFLFSLGFPRGYQMVTSSLVSYPNRDRHHSFITDALFNPGFSGGAVIAINGGVPGFEWVGIARSSSASREWILVPDENETTEHLLTMPYRNDIFIQQKSRIDYGITHVISSSRIQQFLSRNVDELADKGYNLRNWIAE